VSSRVPALTINILSKDLGSANTIWGDVVDRNPLGFEVHGVLPEVNRAVNLHHFDVYNGRNDEKGP